MDGLCNVAHHGQAAGCRQVDLDQPKRFTASSFHLGDGDALAAGTQ